jgi:hypothetical protein
MPVSNEEYAALLKMAEQELQDWKNRFVNVSHVSLTRADLLHKIVEYVRGHSVEEGTYNEADIPMMVRDALMDKAADKDVERNDRSVMSALRSRLSQ